MSNNIVKGFKATLSDMTCRGYQYRLNETHSIVGDLIFAGNGFHFCKKLFDVFLHYNPTDGIEYEQMRLFEVEASGDSITKGDVTCCPQIRLVTELCPLKLLNIYENEYDCIGLKAMAINRGLQLDIFVKDSNPYIRQLVAESGYGLDILSNDENILVRDVALGMVEKTDREFYYLEQQAILDNQRANRIRRL